MIYKHMGEHEPLVHGAETDLGVLLRAIRSFAWNQHLLPLVQARLDRAESIVRSQLLLSGQTSLEVGPFGVSLNEDQDVTLSWHASDDWQQPYLPELDPLGEDPLGPTENPLPWQHILPHAVSPETHEQPEETPKALFEMGQIMVTPYALASLSRLERHPVQLLTRHVTGDWGDLPEEDVKENQFSLEHGYRLFSAYVIEDAKFYVITEWDRSVTTVLLPDEY
jgi:hypothetical protein